MIDDGGTVIADSNAILVYLAKRYGDAHWLPDDPAGAAVAALAVVCGGPIASGPAAARLVTVFGAQLDQEAAKRTAAKVLDVIDGELAGKPFAAGAQPTIADVAAYSYIAHAPEGGVSLERIRTCVAGAHRGAAGLRRDADDARGPARRVTPTEAEPVQENAMNAPTVPTAVVPGWELDTAPFHAGELAAAARGRDGGRGFGRPARDPALHAGPAPDVFRATAVLRARWR